MLAAIGWTLIGIVIGGFIILWIQRTAYAEIVRLHDEAYPPKGKKPSELEQFYREPDLTFTRPDPAKRKPGRPRKTGGVMIPITEPVIMTKPPKKRRIN